MNLQQEYVCVDIDLIPKNAVFIRIVSDAKSFKLIF